MRFLLCLLAVCSLQLAVAASPVVLFQDTFEETLEPWTSVGSGWQLCEEGEGTLCATGEQGGFIVTGQPDWRNYLVETHLVMSEKGGGGALIGRVTADGQSFYQLEVRERDNGDKVWQLQKNIQGEWTTLRYAPFDFELETSYTLRLQFLDRNIVASIAETDALDADGGAETAWQRLSAHDGDIPQGRVGVKSLAGGVRFDAVRVEAPPAENASSEYYVAPYGMDGPGTLEWPFRTVQQCASVVQAGESCTLRAGTYREEVKPAHSGSPGSPIVFKPYPGDRVTLSGADGVEGWQQHEGDIYKAPVDWDLGVGNNQVFVGGQMMTEARWPNTELDPSRPRKARVIAAEEGNGWLLETPDLPPVDEAYINLGIGAFGYAWVTQSGRARRSADTRLEVKALETPFKYDPAADNPFFLWGDRALLDSPGEWFYDSAERQLYLWSPDGNSPEAHAVEVKRRPVALDLRDRSEIQVQNLDIFAATVQTNANSSAVRLQGLDVTYPSHYTFVTQPWIQAVGDTGVVLHGRGNTLQDSRIAYSAGNGVTLHGAEHTLRNNVIHDVGYAGDDTAAVTTACIVCDGGSTGHRVTHNTLHSAGRGLLVHRKTQNLSVNQNHLYDSCLQMEDCGATYTYETDGAGTEIAYNVIHDNRDDRAGIGIYLDNASRNFVVHHNLVWGSYDALRLNLPSRDNLIVSNTLLATNSSVDYAGDGDMDGTRVINTLANEEIRLVGGETVTNLSHESPEFLDAKAHDYRLQETSPARDSGTELSPYTDSFAGFAPDIGALEYGAELWRFGANLGDVATAERHATD